MDMNDNPLNELEQNEWDALIISILKPFYSLCKKDALVTPEDLQQEAWIGLLAACERYDPNKAKFVTYAYHYIRGHVMRYVAKRTKNKPVQIDEDPVLIDEREYEETNYEKHDLMNTIMGNVSDQEHANLLIEHFVLEKSFRQIAKEHGVSHEAIATRIHKLLDLLEIRLNHGNS
jgi:RNA polymerase sigma factor (sigma-70 family)